MRVTHTHLLGELPTLVCGEEPGPRKLSAEVALVVQRAVEIRNQLINGDKKKQE